MRGNGGHAGENGRASSAIEAVIERDEGATDRLFTACQHVRGGST